MKTFLVSALALGAMTSVALATEPTSPQAGPVELTDAQMDGITAGQLIEVEIERTDVAVAVPVSAQVGANVLCVECEVTQDQDRPGRINIRQ